jgi:hypothetical protein
MRGMSSVARAHRGLTFAFLAAAIVAFFLAGLGAFRALDGHDNAFDPHAIAGTLLTVVSLVILILAAIGRREALQQSAVLFGLMVVQNVLGAAGQDAPILGALHPVNALLILFVAHQTARALPLPIGGQRAAHDTVA